MDATQLAQLVFHLVAAKKSFDEQFSKVKRDVDIEIDKYRSEFETVVDETILPRMVLHSSEFMTLIKADHKTQTAWLKQLEKGLGLTPKQPKATTATREETINKARNRQLSAEQMYQKMISKKGLNF